MASSSSARWCRCSSFQIDQVARSAIASPLFERRIDGRAESGIVHVLLRQLRRSDRARADAIEQVEHEVVLHRHVHGQGTPEARPFAPKGGRIVCIELLLLHSNACAQRLVGVAPDGERYRPGQRGACGVGGGRAIGHATQDRVIRAARPPCAAQSGL